MNKLFSKVFLISVVMILVFVFMSITVYGEYENIAIQKAVSVSDVYDDDPTYAEGFAVDGDFDTRWAGRMSESEPDYDNPYWIKVDLGGLNKITEVGICFEMAETTLDIEVSTDGKSFNYLLTDLTSTNYDLNTLLEDRQLDKHDFEEVVARYVRIISPSYMSIWQLEVYGEPADDTTTPTIEPTIAPTEAPTDAPTPQVTPTQVVTQPQESSNNITYIIIVLAIVIIAVSSFLIFKKKAKLK